MDSDTRSALVAIRQSAGQLYDSLTEILSPEPDPPTEPDPVLDPGILVIEGPHSLGGDADVRAQLSHLDHWVGGDWAGASHNAPLSALDPGTVEVVLDGTGHVHDSGAAGRWHELSVLHRPLRRAAFEVDVQLGSDGRWDFGRASKVGGPFCFDGQWSPSHWPGGNNTPSGSCSARITTDQDRWALYGYLGTDRASEIEDTSGRRPHSSLGGHRFTLINDDIEPVPGKWHHHRLETDLDGGLWWFIDGVVAADVPFVPWLEPGTTWDRRGPGWNRAYISAMFGGNDASYGPKTADGKATMAYRNVRVLDLS